MLSMKLITASGRDDLMAERRARTRAMFLQLADTTPVDGCSMQSETRDIRGLRSKKSVSGAESVTTVTLQPFDAQWLAMSDITRSAPPDESEEIARVIRRAMTGCCESNAAELAVNPANAATLANTNELHSGRRLTTNI
jgi:hypothetical protein